MSAEKWLEELNRMTEEELEELFCGMAVRLLTYHGKIVRVENCAIY